MLKKLFILFTIAYLFCGMKHPLHVSVTNIEYNQTKKEVEISCKMFLNDLISILEIKNKRKIDLKNTSPIEEKNNIAAINNYLSEHFSIEINHHKINFTNFEFVQKKINEESVWLYYTIPYQKSVRNFKIYNSFLIDLYSDQTNLLIVNINGEQKGFNLNSKTSSAIINF